MCLVARKPVFDGLQTTKAKTSLRSLISTFVICLLENIISMLAASKITNFWLVSVADLGWFESHFVGNPKDRFSRVTAHMMSYNLVAKLSEIETDVISWCQNMVKDA